uniref:6-phosphofructo-2-kinase domain-containing protein n=1 Tax=Rhizochromulina marina TaxID=1034831 RepID=A0A7S2SNR4_9STRA
MQIIFVELINSDTMIHEKEMADQDVAGAASLDSAEDYRARVAHYKRHYEPIASGGPDDPEHEFSYIKCIENGKQIIMNKIKGYMPGRVAQFITNCCHCHWTTKKKLFLTRHGQSEYNAMGRIGGDPDLTEMGERYALALKDFAESAICRDLETGKELPARLWTSSLKRTRRTARHIANPTIIRDGYPWIQMKPRIWSNLDEIYAGACDGMTYREIEEQFAKEAIARKKDKLTYRYPRGESYLDVIQRLEPLIQEIERHREPLIIVGHQGVLRMIKAYYKGIPREEAPHQTLKLNHVTELIPHAYGCDEKLYNLLPDETPGDDGQTKH